MKNKQVIHSWNKIEMDCAADARMLDTILLHKRALAKKQERVDTVFICIVQMLLLIMALSILVIVTVIIPGTGAVLLMIHIILGGLISVIVILRHTKTAKRSINSHD